MRPLMAIFRDGHACLKLESPLQLCPCCFGEQVQKLNVLLFMCCETTGGQRKLSSSSCPCHWQSAACTLNCQFLLHISSLFQFPIGNLRNFFSLLLFFPVYARLRDYCTQCQSTCYLRHLALWRRMQFVVVLCQRTSDLFACGYPQGLTKAQKELTDVFI